MPDILEMIAVKTLQRIQDEKRLVSPNVMRQKAEAVARVPKSFADALKKHSPAIIAELKKASPSKGIIRNDLNVEELACELASHEAAALSVLTEPFYFKGDINYISKVASQVDIPLLRKDFILDEYQLHESLLHGADACLLIAALLPQKRFAELFNKAKSLGLDVLAEVHDEDELARAVGTGASIIGVNARNLKTFHTDLARSAELLEKIPAGIVRVAESGIANANDMAKLKADAFLIGETLMRQTHPGDALDALLEKST